MRKKMKTKHMAFNHRSGDWAGSILKGCPRSVTPQRVDGEIIFFKCSYCEKGPKYQLSLRHWRRKLSTMKTAEIV
jgi:hypothetical protein